MRIAVIGSGPAGQAGAALLARSGHDVTLFERAEALRPVGAGLLLSLPGQSVLRTLGCTDTFEQLSTPIRSLRGTNHRGKVVLDLRSDDMNAGSVGRGVHRAALAALLDHAVAASGAAAGRRDHPLHVKPAGRHAP